MQNEFSKSVYRYAVGLYLIIATYIWYVVYSFYLFLGKNYFPQNVSSIFSIQNSNFASVNVTITSVLTVIFILLLLWYKSLRNFIMDVSDELCRVSWPSFKETQKSTAVVILLLLIVGFVLFLADTVFLKFINSILGTAA